MKLRQSIVANSSSCSFYIPVDKNQDAHCKFTSKKDNKKHEINLTKYYEYEHVINESIGVLIEEPYLFNYTPESYDEISEMISKLIDLFINLDYADHRYFNEQSAFEVCKLDNIIVDLINYLAKGYLNWLIKEIENDKEKYKIELSFIDFDNMIDSIYENEEIEDKIWESSDYKNQNYTEIEFYNSIQIRESLDNALDYCKYYIKLLVYLYKYNTNI